jgi:hypothetical protein
LAAAGCDIKVDDGKVSLGVSRGRASDEWTRTYTLSKNGLFELVNENGDIEVHGSDGQQVTVKASREVSDSSDEEARRRLQNLKMREDVSADRVHVQAEPGEAFRFGRSVSIRYTVELPRALSVSARTTNGAVRVDNVAGAVNAGSTNGTVVGEALSGAVQAQTVNGGVQMDLADVGGEVRLTTVNGAVRLQIPASANAELEATTVNGGVSVDDRLGLANASRNRGGFGPVTNVTGRLNKGGPRVSLQTTNGGVRVSVRGAPEAR